MLRQEMEYAEEHLGRCRLGDLNEIGQGDFVFRLQAEVKESLQLFLALDSV